ncbi:response regulator [Pelagibius marinus]|uniref:response regulator n=1 Tax=Pelagibius marinus TaxID=2762760 RepID=UPI00187313FF|nr:response regulator [Pelagibius marinus]
MEVAPKVLIVEDERMIAEYFKVLVESLGYDVCGIAKSADEAVRLAREEDPAMVFMDVRLVGAKDGVDAANEICRFKSVPTVYVTGSNEQETIDRIKTDHPADILIKPVLAEQIEDALIRFCPRP